MLINQIATFLSNKSVLYLFSVIDNLRFNFGGKFKFIDFREKPTFTKWALKFFVRSRASAPLTLQKMSVDVSTAHTLQKPWARENFGSQPRSYINSNLAFINGIKLY